MGTATAPVAAPLDPFITPTLRSCPHAPLQTSQCFPLFLRAMLLTTNHIWYSLPTLRTEFSVTETDDPVLDPVVIRSSGEWFYFLSKAGPSG